MKKKLLSTRQTAKQLNVSRQTLSNWNLPCKVKIGGKLYYKMRDIEKIKEVGMDNFLDWFAVNKTECQTTLEVQCVARPGQAYPVIVTQRSQCFRRKRAEAVKSGFQIIAQNGLTHRKYFIITPSRVNVTHDGVFFKYDLTNWWANCILRTGCLRIEELKWQVYGNSMKLCVRTLMCRKNGLPFFTVWGIRSAVFYHLKVVFIKRHF